MGVDLHMAIVKNNIVIDKDIFPGRNSEWFGQLTGNGRTKEEYEYLTMNYNWKEDLVPAELLNEFKEEDGYYGFRMIKVSVFTEWYRQYRPDLDAGWVTKYEAWLYKTKRIEPESICHNLACMDHDPKDVEFIEVANKYDCSKWLYDYLYDNKIMDGYIVFCFDC